MKAPCNYVLDARTATSRFPGIGRYVACLTEAMDPWLESGERLWVFGDPGSSPAWGRPESSSGRVERVPVPLTPFSIRAQWEVPRQLKRLSADVYHSPYFVMPYLADVRTVLTIYDLIPQRLPDAVALRARWLTPLLMRFALRRADHVVTVSEATRRELLDANPSLRSRSSSIPLAAAPRFEPQPPEAIDRIRRKYALADRFLLYVGSNKPHKNLLRLLQAWRHVVGRSEKESPQLILAGPWDDRYPQPKRFASEHGLAPTTRFLGPVEEPDLPALFGAAAALVSPSLEEGFGLPVIEAMACGTPVVCSRIPSLVEVAREAALYFDPLSVADLADRIEHCLRSPSLRRKLRGKGREAASRYSWSDSARQTLSVYRRVAVVRGSA